MIQFVPSFNIMDNRYFSLSSTAGRLMSDLSRTSTIKPGENHLLPSFVFRVGVRSESSLIDTCMSNDTHFRNCYVLSLSPPSRITSWFLRLSYFSWLTACNCVPIAEHGPFHFAAFGECNEVNDCTFNVLTHEGANIHERLYSFSISLIKYSFSSCRTPLGLTADSIHTGGALPFHCHETVIRSSEHDHCLSPFREFVFFNYP
jgi:hypothetical protein